VDGVKDRGSMALKFIPSACKGMMDRLVLLPGGRAVWVELKKDDGVLSAMQIKRRKELQALGFKVYVLYGAEAVADFLKGLDDGSI
jgi:hypothetical protein